MIRPLRLGIDAHRLVCEPLTSGALYLSSFLEGIRALGGGKSLEVYLYVPYSFDIGNPYAAMVLDAGFVLRQPTKGFNPALRYRKQLRWNQLTLPRLAAHDRLDVFFCPFHLTPLFFGRVPIVTTILDVCSLSHPQCFSRLGRLIHKAQFWSAINRADRLVAASEYTAASLARFYPTAAEKILVVGIGLGRKAPSGCTPGSVAPANSYFVWIGNAEKRKSAPLVFESYRRYLDLTQCSDTLVAVVPRNQAAFFRELAMQHGLGTRLAILSEISEEEKRALLRNSIALLFPSQCEGFGLPTLEAMQEGCIPIVYSDGPGPELTSKCVPALPELTPTAVCEMMVWARNLNLDAKTRIGQSLQKLAEKFSATAMARELLTVFEEAAGAAPARVGSHNSGTEI